MFKLRFLFFELRARFQDLIAFASFELNRLAVSVMQEKLVDGYAILILMLISPAKQQKQKQNSPHHPSSSSS